MTTDRAYGKNVLIIGGSGQLGKSLSEFMLKKGYTVNSTYNTKAEGTLQLDVTDRKRTFEVITKFHPDVIIDTHSLLARECERDHELAWKVNVEGTKNIAEAAIETASGLIFISSDYIFDGTKKKYDERETLSPVNQYGFTKAVSEAIVRYFVPDSLIIRTSGIYGARKGFPKLVYNTLKNGNNFEVYIDQYVSPTFVENLTEIIVLLYQKGEKGIFNIASDKPMSKYEFAVKVCKRFNLNRELLIPVATKEKSIFTGGKIKLDTKKLEKALGMKPQDLKEGLNMVEFD